MWKKWFKTGILLQLGAVLQVVDFLLYMHLLCQIFLPWFMNVLPKQRLYVSLTTMSEKWTAWEAGTFVSTPNVVMSCAPFPPRWQRRLHALPTSWSCAAGGNWAALPRPFRTCCRCLYPWYVCDLTHWHQSAGLCLEWDLVCPISCCAAHYRAAKVLAYSVFGEHTVATLFLCCIIIISHWSSLISVHTTLTQLL